MFESDLADIAPTPGALLGRVAFARRVADDAEVEILEIAVEWAHSHPDLDADGVERAWRVRRPVVWQPGEIDASVVNADDVETVEWCGIPGIAWDAPAAFAAALGMTTAAGKALIRDALVLKHRLPLVWERVLGGEVQAWRARRIAQAVLGAHGDVVAHLDALIAPIAGRVGPTTWPDSSTRRCSGCTPRSGRSIATERARSRSLVVEQRPRPRHEAATERVETQ